jgi:Yip1-like protein
VIARCPSCYELFPILGSCRAACPLCGKAVDIIVERASSAFADAQLEPEPSAPPTAWESHDKGLAARFFETLRAVLTRPRPFFRALEAEAIGGSLSFLALVLAPVILVQSASAYVLLMYLGAVRVSFLIFAPLVAMLFIAYLTTFYQAAIAIASGRRPPLSATIRGTCFGFAPMIVGVVPFIGLVIGFGWSLVLHGIALRELHGLNRVQALAVVTIPLVVLASQLSSPMR